MLRLILVSSVAVSILIGLAMWLYRHAFPAVEVDITPEGLAITVRRRPIFDVAVCIERNSLQRQRLDIGTTVLAWSQFDMASELSHATQGQQISATVGGRMSERCFIVEATFTRLGQATATSQIFRWTPKTRLSE